MSHHYNSLYRWNSSPTNKFMSNKYSYECSETNTDGADQHHFSKMSSNGTSASSVSKIVSDIIRWQCNQPQQYKQQQRQRQQHSNHQQQYNSHTLSSYESEMEQAILSAIDPIDIDGFDNEQIEVNGECGIWANKAEVAEWQQSNRALPLGEYKINQDVNPVVITKHSNRCIEYVQEIAIRYLRPPTPPPPGDIIIQQLADMHTPPAPPLIIRQQPPRPCTPEPIVIREAPPPPPLNIGRKVITISGKRIPPPPRKVIIERLAPIPPKPQSVIIERWLPYNQVKRRVIFSKAPESLEQPIVVKPRNVIVQWTAPQVQIKREFKYLGVIRANPDEYVKRYCSVLRDSRALPSIVNEIPRPQGLILAAELGSRGVPELEGDIDALRLIDLDREGLSEYKTYLNRTPSSASSSNPYYHRNQRRAAPSAVYVSSTTASRPPPPPIMPTNQQFVSSLNYRYSSPSTSIESQPLFSPSPPHTKLPLGAYRQQNVNNPLSPVASINSTFISSAAISPSFSAVTAQIPVIHSTSATTTTTTPTTSATTVIKSPYKLNRKHSQLEPQQQRKVAASLATEAMVGAAKLQRKQNKTSNKKSKPGSSESTSATSPNSSGDSGSSSRQPSSSTSASSTSCSINLNDEFVECLFKAIDLDQNGRITVNEAEKVLLKLNSRLQRMYGEDDVSALFSTLDIDQDGTIDIEEFKAGFRNLDV